MIYRFWRISNHFSLSGEGGMRASARWHNKGRPIVYLAESPSAALLEVLVHLKSNIEEMPDTYTLLQIEVEPKPRIPSLGDARPTDWKTNLSWSRGLGDEWLRSNRTVFARIPSVVIPHTFNYLLNPLHAEAANVRITRSTEEQFDPRLFGLGRER